MANNKSDIVQRIADLSDGKRTAREIADTLGYSFDYVRSLIHTNNLPKVRLPKGFALKPRKRSQENESAVQKIRELCDGSRTSKQLAKDVGVSPKYVQKIMKIYDLPRRPQGAPTGELNFAYAGGRRIDLDGYVLVSAPPNHPRARRAPGKNIGMIYEHRLVMEKEIGRFLGPREVVDHIDGLHLHNAPENLRLFASNADHLRATISGKVPQWSDLGVEKMSLPADQKQALPLVDSYYDRRARGDVRLQQILLAWLSLGKDSPYLSCTRRWLVKAGIEDYSRSSLELHLQMLSRQ